MSLFSQFKTDSDKERNGVEITYAANEDGTIPTFIIARAAKSNREWSKEYERQTKPYRRQIELKTFPNEKAEEIALSVFVKIILKGWSNVQDESGNEIPFTQENAIQLFKSLPELYEDLDKQSGDMALFKASAREEEAKN